MKLKVCIVILTAMISLPAKANLQVYPLRILLGDKNKTAQVSLRHRGATAVRYKISLVYYRMSKDGSMSQAEKTLPSDHFAGDLIRFSPRQVLLAPNVEQVARIALRLPADLADGEYRAHMLFEPLEEKIEDSAQKAETETKMILKARLAIAIPIVIRRGKTATSISLKNLRLLKLPDGKQQFEVTMIKDGTASFYGDGELFFTPDAGSEFTVTAVRGLSSYISERSIRMPIETSISGAGKLRLIFKGAVDEGAAESETTTDVR